MEADAITAGITGASDLAKLGWLLICSALVFFMQAGFAAVETGSVRYKNSINVALKNVIDLCCSFAAFFVVGYSLMFGASITIGLPGFTTGVAKIPPPVKQLVQPIEFLGAQLHPL